MRTLQVIAGGLLAIALLLAIAALALYAIWRVVMVVVAWVPMIGRRHRHRDWDRLQKWENPLPREPPEKGE